MGPTGSDSTRRAMTSRDHPNSFGSWPPHRTALLDRRRPTALHIAADRFTVRPRQPCSHPATTGHQATAAGSPSPRSPPSVCYSRSVRRRAAAYLLVSRSPAEVTVSRATHDGLGATKLPIRAEHRLCREVDTAGEQRPDVGCSDRAEVLRKPASRHVDRVRRVRVFDDLGFDGELILDVVVLRMRVPRAYRLGLPFRMRFSNRPTNEEMGALRAEFALKCSHDRDNGTGLDLNGVQRSQTRPEMFGH
jgi:hypothetical protein